MNDHKPSPRSGDHQEERADDDQRTGGAWLWACPVPGCDTTEPGDADAPTVGDGRCPVHSDRTLHRRTA